MQTIVDLSSRWIIGILLGLLFLLTITYIVLAFGISEKDCVNYSSKHLVIIEPVHNDACDWLVDKLLYNGSGFHITGYGTLVGNTLFGPTQQSEKFVMTK